MIYIFLANGFEECEALATIDILRRAGFDIKTVGVGSKTITSTHNIPIVCDIQTNEVNLDNLQAVILPGGMPGTTNLENDKTVSDVIDYAFKNDILIGAICAAPLILGHKNILIGKNATCFPGFEDDLYGAVISDERVVKDGNIITACGVGVAFEFGFKILSALTSNEKTQELKKQMKFL